MGWPYHHWSWYSDPSQEFKFPLPILFVYMARDPDPGWAGIRN